MAEINTVIAEASQDLQTIEDFVNLPADSDVRPRLLPSVNVGTLAGTRQAIFEAGGLPATPFKTKALMTASALVDGKYAMVTDDTVNNGLYVKAEGAWVNSEYDPVIKASVYTDKAVKLANEVITAEVKNSLDDLNNTVKSTTNLVNPNQSTSTGRYVLSSNGEPSVESGYIAGLDYIPVVAGGYIWTNFISNGDGFAIYNSDKKYLTTVLNSASSKVFQIPKMVNGNIPAFIRISRKELDINNWQMGLGKLVPSVKLAYLEDYYFHISNAFKIINMLEKQQ